VTSFGARLKQEREKRGITLDEIALSTKIGTRMLQALEQEHFDQLPGGIFNKGFVRAYARHVGLDEQEAISDYLAAIGEEPAAAANAPLVIKPQPAPPPYEDENGAARVPWIWLAVALLVIACSFAGWNFYSRENQREVRKQPTPPVVEAPSPQPPAESATQPSSAPAVTAAASTVESAQPSPATSAPPPPTAAAPAAGTFVVRVKAREDSWLTITADGQRILQDTLVADEEKSIPARQTITIRAGNVGALDIYFNGNKLSNQGDFGEVKTLTFDPHGLVVPPKPPATDSTTPPADSTPPN